MKKCSVAVLGVSGVVGQEMLKILEEYQIPVERLVPLAGKRSAGKKITFAGKEYTIQEASADSFEGVDYVLGAVEKDQSMEYAPYIQKAGAVYIDNSSAFRMNPDVPLVVPEINGEDAFQNKGIIANPNCSTIITMMALAGIHKISPIQSAVACTYQAVSGAGINGLHELEQQMDALAKGQPVERNVFPHQIALNVIPCIGSEGENGYTAEEMKMQNEGRRILHNPELNVTCTCVRVPVMRSHSISVTFQTKDKITIQQAQEAVKSYPGCKLIEDYEGRNYPTPLDTGNQDDVWVGRIRQDLTCDHGLTLWCCGDQIRKGAAANAVQIMRLLLEKE